MFLLVFKKLFSEMEDISHTFSYTTLNQTNLQKTLISILFRFSFLCKNLMFIFVPFHIVPPAFHSIAFRLNSILNYILVYSLDTIANYISVFNPISFRSFSVPFRSNKKILISILLFVSKNKCIFLSKKVQRITTTTCIKWNKKEIISLKCRKSFEIIISRAHMHNIS